MDNSNKTHTGEHAHSMLAETEVVTRFPPSPTGPFHVGSARTVLFNYLFAKAHEGEMVMRFEDTDTERSDAKWEDDILDGIEWLELDFFGPLFRQSERTDIYQSYLEKLLEEDDAYISEETEGERDTVIRFRNPNTTIQFNDLVRGTIEFDTSDLGDFVIAKSKGEPLYHLAVVVDDHEMEVSHVIRGDDHISNTPRQILIQEALGIPRPQYAHIPLILGPDKAKLSKRHGATSLAEYQERGYLPEAMVNYLALLGWNPGNEQEIFTMEELIDEFELDRVQKSAAVFDIEKLKWFNKQHLMRLDDHELLHNVRTHMPEDIEKLPDYSPERLERLLPIFRERLETFSDVTDMANSGDLEFYFESPGYHTRELLWKDEDSLENTKDYLEHVRTQLKEIPEDQFTEESVKESVWEYSGEQGRGNVLWPMRYALSGKEQSPGPFQLSAVLGKDVTLERLKAAITSLENEINKEQ